MIHKEVLKFHFPEYNIEETSTGASLVNYYEGLRVNITFNSAAKEAKIYINALEHSTFGIANLTETIRIIKKTLRNLGQSLSNQFETPEAYPITLEPYVLKLVLGGVISYAILRDRRREEDILCFNNEIFVKVVYVESCKPGFITSFQRIEPNC